MMNPIEIEKDKLKQTAYSSLENHSRKLGEGAEVVLLLPQSPVTVEEMIEIIKSYGPGYSAVYDGTNEASLRENSIIGSVRRRFKVSWKQPDTKPAAPPIGFGSHGA